MKKRITKHFLFWFFYLSFEVYTQFEWVLGQYQYLTPYQVFYMVFSAETILVVLIKIPIVYIVFVLVMRYNTNRFKKLNLIIIGLVVMIIFMVLYQYLSFYLIDSKIYKIKTSLKLFEFQNLLNSFMDIIFILVTATSVKQYSISQQLRVKSQLLIKEKLETELNFLKAQINPHFLFNTLNNIYALARKKSDETPNVVVKLSKLLRFVLYESQQKKITLAKEIQFLKDYIELEKIRYDTRLEIKFNWQIDDLETYLAPLILIPLIENAFKHGASETTSNAFIHINLALNNGLLSFSVQNSFEYENKTSDGIGLKNLRRQLELLYPIFNLRIKIEDNAFNAQLLIDLTN